MPELQYYTAGEGLLVAFDTKSVENPAKSKAAGSPKYDEVEYIHLRNPGDRNSGVHRPVRDADRSRFAQQYEAFKKGLERPADGTPLEDWAGATRRQVDELRGAHVRTVEVLASMSETNAGKMGLGYPELRAKARDFLEAQKGGAPLERLRAEAAETKSQLHAARERITALEAEVDRLRAEGGSRKRKE